MAKKAAFISFDFDHDESQRNLLAGQANLPDSPFDFYDRSVKDHLAGDWKAKVRGRIHRADLVIVLCGEKTHTAVGVSEELKIAKELGKPYFLLAAYPGRNCTRPASALPSESLYKWTWENLKTLVGGGR